MNRRRDWTDFLRIPRHCALFVIVAVWAASAMGAAAPMVPAATTATAAQLHRLAPELELEIIECALRASIAARAHGVGGESRLLTVIDYSKPSTVKRLWVFDVATPRLLFHELVAHGKNSGDRDTVSFSNRVGSRQTSLGLFVTADAYVGDNGYSLRLRGLHPGFNCRAAERAVVVHGAPYVSESFVRAHGRIGRSWGCPAVPADVARPLIDTIKGGSLVFAYGRDPEWLAALEPAAPATASTPSAAPASGSRRAAHPPR